MLSVANKPIMLSVANKPIMLSVFMPSVVILNVMAPLTTPSSIMKSK